MEKNTNTKLNNLEKALSRSLKSNCAISEDFENNLKTRLINLHNLNTENMNNNKQESQAKSELINPNLASKLNVGLLLKSLAFLTLLIMVGTGIWYFTKGNKPQKEVFGSLSVIRGEAYIERDGEEITVKEGKIEDLRNNDVVKTSQETIADAQTPFGRVSMSDDSEIIINVTEDENIVKLIDGSIYTRSTRKDEVKIEASLGSIDIKDGAALTSIQKLDNEDLDTDNADNATNTDSPATDDSTVDSETQTDNTYEISLKSIAGKISATVKAENTTKTTEVSNGKKVTIKTGEITPEEEFDRSIFETEFLQHNIEKDKESKYDQGTAKDITPPTITIKQPEDGLVTENNQITVTGSSNENGWAYFDGKWNSIEANKDFEYTITLKSGENKVLVKVKDSSYNIATKEITITYNNPISITLNNIVAQNNGIYIKWSATNIDANYTYLVRRSLNATESDTKNNVLIIKADATTKEWVDTATVKGNTYYYHVILLGPDGFEVKRTNIVSAVAINQPPVVTPPPPSNECSLGLWLISKTTAQADSLDSIIATNHLAIVEGSGTATVGWSITGNCPEYSGVKVVWNKTGSPVYPGDSNKYITSGATSLTIANLSAGRWYIRVGLYKDGGILQYSNQIAVDI